MGKHVKKWDRCFDKLKKEKGESGAAAICSSSIDNAGLKAKNQKRDKKDYYSNKKKADKVSDSNITERYSSTDEDNYDVDTINNYKNSDEFWNVALNNTVWKDFKGMNYPMCKTCDEPTKVKFTDERQFIGNDNQQIVICEKCGTPFVFEERYQVGYNNMKRSGMLAEEIVIRKIHTVLPDYDTFAIINNGEINIIHSTVDELKGDYDFESTILKLTDEQYSEYKNHGKLSGFIVYDNGIWDDETEAEEIYDEEDMEGEDFIDEKNIFNFEKFNNISEDAFSNNATYPGPPLVNKLAGKMVGSGSDGILSSPRNTEIENGDDSVTSTGEFPLKYGDIKKQKVKSMQSRQRKSALKKIAKLNKMSASGIQKMKSFDEFSKKDDEENN